jgi:hypothetical protein
MIKLLVFMVLIMSWSGFLVSCENKKSDSPADSPGKVVKNIKSKVIAPVMKGVKIPVPLGMVKEIKPKTPHRAKVKFPMNVTPEIEKSWNAVSKKEMCGILWEKLSKCVAVFGLKKNRKTRETKGESVKKCIQLYNAANPMFFKEMKCVFASKKEDCETISACVGLGKQFIRKKLPKLEKWVNLTDDGKCRRYAGWAVDCLIESKSRYSQLILSGCHKIMKSNPKKAKKLMDCVRKNRKNCKKLLKCSSETPKK